MSKDQDYLNLVKIESGLLLGEISNEDLESSGCFIDGVG